MLKETCPESYVRTGAVMVRTYNFIKVTAMKN